MPQQGCASRPGLPCSEAEAGLDCEDNSIGRDLVRNEVFVCLHVACPKSEVSSQTPGIEEPYLQHWKERNI